jgi:hypothetical protein
MAPLGSTPLAILSLQQAVLARKDDAGERSLALVVKSECGRRRRLAKGS